MKFLFPLPVNSNYVETQSYEEHVEAAKRRGCCWRPGVNCSCFYFGGIDWAVPNGTKVVAAADGTIERAVKDSSGYGIHVRINHKDGILTIYGHLQSVTVKKGDVVLMGDVIGYSNNTGNSSGPHLHFEARKNNVPFDPEPYLVYNDDDPDPEPTPGNPFLDLKFPEKYRFARTTETMTIRSKPELSGKVLGYTGSTETLEFYGVSVENNGRTWLKIGSDRWFCGYGSDGTMYAILLP